MTEPSRSAIGSVDNEKLRGTETRMGIYYESEVVGSVRAETIGGQTGLGASHRRFGLAWNLFPKRVDAITLFGTSIWVSVVASGDSSPVLLGQATPETAWCEESRDGQPFDRHLTYRLSLSDSQLLGLEQMRQGRGLTFTLEVRGNSQGSRGVRSIDETIQMPVNVSEWTRVLKEANGADVLLVGVHLPIGGQGMIGRAAIDLVRRANEHLALGHYSAAVAECRLAIESIWRSANLAAPAGEARRRLANMEGQRSMSKRQRELALGEALRNFCHTAHHVGDNAEPEIFGRTDAALAVSTAAALISSLAADPDLVQVSPRADAAAAHDGGRRPRLRAMRQRSRIPATRMARLP